MITADEALEAIQAMLDGSTWDAETLDDIAAIVRQAGYEVREPLAEDNPAGGENC
jgi:hypothetical protein